MNEVIEFVDVEQTMSSLEIARLTGRDHAHVMRDIRNMEPAWEKISINITRADGRPDVVLHTEWTQAGRRFLYEELKKHGIIPMLERS